MINYKNNYNDNNNNINFIPSKIKNYLNQETKNNYGYNMNNSDNNNNNNNNYPLKNSYEDRLDVIQNHIPSRNQRINQKDNLTNYTNSHQINNIPRNFKG
jgi:hypothetical protein